MINFAVIPAQAGIHMSAANVLWWLREFRTSWLRWTPASAGVTNIYSEA